MRRTGVAAMVTITVLATAGAGMAQTITGKQARTALFSPDPSEAAVLTHPSLTEADLAVIEQIAATQRYYGAVAVSPDEGIASNATVAAIGYHDVASASVVALADCNAKRRAETADCILVAEIRPQGWEPRVAQLSADATQAFRDDYGRGRSTRAMAISPATGKWAIARGADAVKAALADCAAQSRAVDCRVVISD